MVLAYRAFKLDPNGLLRSPLVDYVWTREANQATCRVDLPNLNHTRYRPKGSEPCPDAPNPTCACGLYAYPFIQWEARSFMTQENVIGLVSAYGRLMEHTDGTARSEHMTILAIMMFAEWASEDDALDHFQSTGYATPVKVPRSLLERAAGMLGVPWGVFTTKAEGVSFLQNEAGKYDEETLAHHILIS